MPKLRVYDLRSKDRKDLLKQLGITARELIRTKEAAFDELKLGGAELTDEQLINAMVENPILIERPIVVRGNKARMGRPPEQVLEIL